MLTSLLLRTDTPNIIVDGGEVTALMPDTEGTSMAVTRATDPGEAADVSRSRYVPDSGFGTALFDAKNGFNELNRYLLLWTADIAGRRQVDLPSTATATRT